jgi:hypothetical protein
MNSKSYIKSIFLFITLLLTVTALTNYIVDPGNIYPKYYSQDNRVTPEFFVKKLIESKYGLLKPKNVWNDRDIKKELAIYPDSYDCALIGSSQIMQISSYRQNKSLTTTCPKLKNLGVSGGSLEDYLALTNLVLKNKESLPKVVVFGINPWSLNFGRDLRWRKYEQDYYEMKKKISLKYATKNLSNENESNIALLLNLFNLEYLKSSLSNISKAKIEKVTQASKFNQNIGLDHQVILPDGSLIYSSRLLKRDKNFDDGRNSYKIVNNLYYQQHAIEIFTKLIQHLINYEIDVVLLLTPYHHSVWNNQEQPIIEAFKIVEEKVHDIAKQNKIKVIGSFNPNNIGCLENEFTDTMHSTDECLMKLESRVVLYKKNTLLE